MLLTIIIFILILGVLVLVHEFGHFIVAKLSGIRVEEFAFGFPPRIWAIKKGDTTYAINLIPLGGYVKLYWEDDEPSTNTGQSSKREVSDSFAAKPVRIRVGIVVAGVIMNFILAIVLMTFGFTVGMTPLVSDPATLPGSKESNVMVIYVQPDSPAAKAGIKNNDIIDGFSSTTDLQQFTRSRLGQTVPISIHRDSINENLDVKLSDNEDSPLGVGIVSITKVKQNIGQAFVTSITETGKAIGAVFSFLGQLLKSLFTTGKVGQAGQEVVGPVGLFNFTAAAIKIGWIYVLQLVILLSINLGIINILPFPALDGGKLLFLVLEGIFHKKVIRAEIENIIHLVGFILLILLFLAITFNDIRNFF